MFTKLAQKNLDLFNSNPTAHSIVTAAVGMGVVVVGSKIIKRISKEDPTLRSGQNA